MKRVVFAFALITIAAGSFEMLGQVAGPQRGAQGPPNLEAQHQRLLPLFELSGVVYTDADERTGRFTVGVLDGSLGPTVRALANAQGVSFQSVDVVETEPIVPVGTLQDRVRPVVAGVQIRFSQYLCSPGFNAVLGGTAGFVTASHCSKTLGAVDGVSYYQPL